MDCAHPLTSQDPRRKLTRRPLVEGHNDFWVNTPALNAIVPNLGKRAALDPHQQHGSAQDKVDADDDEPDNPFSPPLAEPEQGQAERRFAPGRRKN